MQLYAHTPAANGVQTWQEPIDSVGTSQFADQLIWQEPIDSVGTSQFADQLMQTLQAWVGVEHYAAFHLAQPEARLLATDAALADEQSAAVLLSAVSYCTCSHRVERDARSVGASTLLRLNAQHLSPEKHCRAPGMPDFTDGVFVTGEREGKTFGLALLRTARRGHFLDAELDTLRSIAGTWLSLLSKHERMMRAPVQVDRGPDLLGSVDQIETTLTSLMPTLSKRETQVCARILRGISTPGIAIDLGVREDSVATYRKRAYQRLAIGSRFELIQLFVGSGRSAVPAGP